MHVHDNEDSFSKHGAVCLSFSLLLSCCFHMNTPGLNAQTRERCPSFLSLVSFAAGVSLRVLLGLLRCIIMIMMMTSNYWELTKHFCIRFSKTLGGIYHYLSFRRGNCVSKRLSHFKLSHSYGKTENEVILILGFPGCFSGREPAIGESRDMGLILGLGRLPGEGDGYPFQYSCLENSRDRRAWQATVHGVSKSQIRLNDSHTHNLDSSPTLSISTALYL